MASPREVRVSSSYPNSLPNLREISLTASILEEVGTPLFKNLQAYPDYLLNKSYH